MITLSLLIVALASASIGAGATSGAEPTKAPTEPLLPGVRVLPQPDRPGNPDVSVQTDRLETSYSGPMDPLRPRPMPMTSFTGRIELEKDSSQCFYSVLLAGQFFIQDIQTIRFYQDDKFDVFLTDGQNHVLVSEFQVALFRHQIIVNHTNTYEACIVNRGQRKMLAYNSYRFTPPELATSEQPMETLSNFSHQATLSIGVLEWRVTNVLSYVRAHSETYKDASSLRALNWSIQWRAWTALGLQLLSVGLTTQFIRRLFSEPRGRFALAT